jgi:hypothetical protein
METMNKNMPNERAVSMLVVGTEAKQVLIMDPSGINIMQRVISHHSFSPSPSVDLLLHFMSL